jgi:hypothetical protein
VALGGGRQLDIKQQNEPGRLMFEVGETIFVTWRFDAGSLLRTKDR